MNSSTQFNDNNNIKRKPLNLMCFAFAFNGRQYNTIRIFFFQFIALKESRFYSRLIRQCNRNDVCFARGPRLGGVRHYYIKENIVTCNYKKSTADTVCRGIFCGISCVCVAPCQTAGEKKERKNVSCSAELYAIKYFTIQQI